MTPDDALIIKALRVFAYSAIASARECDALATASAIAHGRAAIFADSAAHHRAESRAALDLIARLTTAPRKPSP